MGSTQDDATRHDKAKLREEMLVYRLAGNSYRMIAEKVGCSLAAAFREVHAALEEVDALTKEKAERVRDLDILRLDRLMTKLASRVNDGDVPAIQTTIRLMERKAKLLGLDAPTKIAPTTPDGEIPFRFTLAIEKPED